MDRADWGDENGSTVTLRLPMDNESEDRRNPFHEYTKRRKGRAGTRFMMVCQTAGEVVRETLYQDETMLAGWNDSQTKGHTVKLWLCNDGMGHPFEGVSRKQPLIISLVELADDETVIDQKMRERVEQQKKRPSERLSYVAAMLCKNEGFWTWIQGDERIKQILRKTDHPDMESLSIEWMCRAIGMKSRSELDKNEAMATRFHEEVRKPFLAWQDGVIFQPGVQ